MFCNVNLIRTYFSVAAVFIIVANSLAQTQPDKVSHAEPLYFDLVRDLGARNGEREFNVGFDFRHNKHYNERAFLVEYEFAPINRLGLEVEVDFSFFKGTSGNVEIPGDRLEGLRLSTQYSIFVSTRLKTTLAVGHTQIFEFADFKHYGKSNLFTGTVYNPFFIAAKRWGENVHTLIYTSPLLEHDFETAKFALSWQINSSFLFTIPQTRHFAGVELNHKIDTGKYELTVRPQAKIKLDRKLAVGLVTGIPIAKTNENCSTFLRIIYEP